MIYYGLLVDHNRSYKLSRIIKKLFADDCGKGSNPDSLITGNAGKRIACSIIGYSKKNFS